MAFSPVSLFLCAALLPFFPANGQDPGFYKLSTNRKDVQREIVNIHNDLRRSVSPPASNMLKMRWDSDTAANAQKWANQCIIRHSKRDSRVIDGKSCGENFYASSDLTSWSDVVRSLYSEEDNFVYGNGPKYPGAAVGHYTQIVWYSSYLVGCGIAYCPNQSSLKYYRVCQYCPGGNVEGKENEPYKEGEPCASCPDHCDNGLCTNPCEYEDEYANCPDLVKTSESACDDSIIKEGCKASCNCPDKIF